MVSESVEILGRLQGIEKHLARLEVALIGDPDVGHKGIVTRLENLELLNAETPSVHQGIEDRARSERGKLHQRIDSLEDQWARIRWTAAGIGLGIGLVSGVSAAWVSNLF